MLSSISPISSFFLRNGLALSVDFKSIFMDVSIGIYALAGIVLALTVLISVFRGFFKSGIRLLTIVISAVLSFFVAPLIAKLFSGMIKDIIVNNLLSENDLSELLDASPTLSEAITVIPLAIATPIVFIITFIILSLLFLIVYKIVANLTALFVNPFKLSVTRLLGALIGVVTAFVIIVTVFFPIAGYFGLASETLDMIVDIESQFENDEESDLETILNEVDKVSSNNIILVTSDSIGHKLFDSMMSGEIRDRDVVISSEIAYLADTYSNIDPLISKKVTEYSQDEAAKVRNIAENILDSNIVPDAVCEIVSYGAGKWSSGDKFIGKNSVSESVPEDLKPLIDELLNIFKNIKKDKLQNDLLTVADLFDVFANYEVFPVFRSDYSSDEIFDLFDKEGLISDFIIALKKNEDFSPVIKCVTDIGLKAAGKKLGLPENDTEVFENLMNDFAVSVNDVISIISEDRSELLNEKLTDVLDSYGINATENDINIISDCLIDGFTDKSEITADDIRDYFGQVAENGIPSASNKSGEIGFISFKDDNSPIISKIENEETGSDNSLLRMLGGIQPLEHQLMTIEDMLIPADVLENMSPDQIKEDASHISRAVKEIVKFYDSYKEIDNIGLSTISKLNLDALSSAVQELNKTVMMGKVSGVIVAGALQNMDLGLPNSVIIDLANGIQSDNGTGYTKDVLTSISNIAEITDKMQNGFNMPDSDESIRKMIRDLTPDSANLISSAVTPSFIQNNVSSLDSKQSSNVSTMVSTLVSNLGEAKKNSISEEESEKETKAIDSLLGIAIDAKDTKDGESVFARYDEEGKLIEEGSTGKTVNEVFESIVDSSVASSTIIETSEEMGYDPFGLSEKLNEQNRNDLIASAQEQLDNGAEEELIVDIVSLFGMNVSIVNGIITE